MNTQIAVLQRNRIGVLLLPWLVWGMSSLFVTYQMLLQTAPSVMITDFENAFSVNAFGVSLLSSCFFYTYLLFQIPSGMLVDRVHPRYCLALCLIGIAASTALLAVSTSLPMAKFSRILQGAFSAPSVVPALYLAAIWFPAKRFALLAGFTEMIGMSGAAIGQAVLAPSVGAYGWRSTLFGCAALGIVMAVLTYIIVQEKKDTDKPVTTKEAAPAQRSHAIRDLLTVISHPQSWINGLFCGLLFAVAGAFGSLWCIPYLMKTYQFSLNLAATASSMLLFGTAFGAPALGWISDYFSARRLPMIISTALVLVCMLLVLYVPGLNTFQIFALLFALGFFSSAYALSFAVMRDIMPENVRGTAMGYTNLMCILIGAPILQPLIGWLLNNELAKNSPEILAYHNAMLALPICLAIGLVLAFLIKETQQA